MSDKKPSSELISAEQGSVFSVWDLPSFDAPVDESTETQDNEVTAEFDIEAAAVEPEVRVEEIVVEDVKPLTLEDVEAVRQDAWNEGFSTGEKDGFHAGQLKAANEAQAVLADKVQTLEHIMREFFEPIASQDQQLEDSMLEMIMHISRQVIQRELKTDSSQIKQVVREALKLLPMGSESVRVYVNPQDFEQIKALRERHEEQWRIIEDDDLLPGGCRFDSVNTQINASIETRIEHIAAQVLDQQRELQSQPLAPDLDIDLHAPIEATPAPQDSTVEATDETVVEDADEITIDDSAQESVTQQPSQAPVDADAEVDLGVDDAVMPADSAAPSAQPAALALSADDEPSTATVDDPTAPIN